MPNKNKLRWIILSILTTLSLSAQCATSALPPSITTLEPQQTAHIGIVYHAEQNINGLTENSLRFLDIVTDEEIILVSKNVVAQSRPVFSWSPVTERLIFTHRSNASLADRELYSVGLGGSKVQLTNNAVEDSGGIWSPDGHQIVFYSRQSDGDSLFAYLMNPDGSNIRPVFDNMLTFAVQHRFEG